MECCVGGVRCESGAAEYWVTRPSSLPCLAHYIPLHESEQTEPDKSISICANYRLKFGEKIAKLLLLKPMFSIIHANLAGK